jgi:DNA polymerase III alpha subunit
MYLDKYNNPIFNEQDIFDAIYQGHQFSVNDTMLIDSRTDSIRGLEKLVGFKFLEPYETYFTQAEYDKACQSNWFMPEKYKDLDIEEFVYSKCLTQISTVRVMQEMAEYKSRDMLGLLRWLKYFVDTCEANNIVRGVGRGSSVASYVLFLLGVHSIDSLKYNLDWHEFLR